MLIFAGGKLEVPSELVLLHYREITLYAIRLLWYYSNIVYSNNHVAANFLRLNSTSMANRIFDSLKTTMPTENSIDVWYSNLITIIIVMYEV